MMKMKFKSFADNLIAVFSVATKSFGILFEHLYYDSLKVLRSKNYNIDMFMLDVNK